MKTTDSPSANQNVKLSFTLPGGKLATLLTVIFAVLKLTGVVSWGWFWVCAPLLAYLALALCFAGLVFGILVLAVEKAQARR